MDPEADQESSPVQPRHARKYAPSGPPQSGSSMKLHSLIPAAKPQTEAALLVAALQKVKHLRDSGNAVEAAALMAKTALGMKSESEHGEKQVVLLRTAKQMLAPLKGRASDTDILLGRTCWTLATVEIKCGECRPHAMATMMQAADAFSLVPQYKKQAEQISFTAVTLEVQLGLDEPHCDPTARTRLLEMLERAYNRLTAAFDEGDPALAKARVVLDDLRAASDKRKLQKPGGSPLPASGESSPKPAKQIDDTSVEAFSAAPVLHTVRQLKRQGAMLALPLPPQVPPTPSPQATAATPSPAVSRHSTPHCADTLCWE